MSIASIAMQDRLPADSPARICFGCGADNLHGLHIKSYMEGDTAICHFTPKSYHTAFPGALNGGIIATILDCHGLWTAMGYYIKHHKDDIENETDVIYVTRKLTIEYLRKTSIGNELTIRGRVTSEEGRTANVLVELFDNSTLCVKGKVLGVRVKGLPEK